MPSHCAFLMWGDGHMERSVSLELAAATGAAVESCDGEGFADFLARSA